MQTYLYQNKLQSGQDFMPAVKGMTVFIWAIVLKKYIYTHNMPNTHGHTY